MLMGGRGLWGVEGGDGPINWIAEFKDVPRGGEAVLGLPKDQFIWCPCWRYMQWAPSNSGRVS